MLGRVTRKCTYLASILIKEIKMTDYTGYAYESLPISEEAINEVREVREAFKVLSQRINSKFKKDARYNALANTALEEAAMWAVKSITHA